MKSQIWRLAGVSVLSLAMFGSALADDGPDPRSVLGGGGSQRDQGRSNSGGYQGGGNQGGGQSRPQQQQGVQGPARVLGGSTPAPRDDRGGYGNGHNQGGYNQGHNNGNGGGYNGGYNGGGYHNGGYSNGGYNGNGNGHSGGRDDDDDDHGRPGNNDSRGSKGPVGQVGAKSPPPPGNQWHGGRPSGGWGPGPRWQPGYRVEHIPQGRWRVPHGGIDYYYADGYWYRPYGPSYIVVTPPYGVRVRTLPSYAEQLWIGSALYFIAAGTYYLYQADRQEYVVTSPPTQVTSNNGWQGNGYDVVAYPARGQGQAQIAQDRYDCHRWAVNQSGFDPSQAAYAPAPNVADIYRRSLGACLAGRGYSVN
ncbi:DUF6515 family protein [Pseudomonas turukhanskensis]|uniref:Glycine zipper family protein n=1 Tax=Pseudomonas turukhanskensis TaxID=1806536 RepID=A0A9W6K8K2_9PSED|nr:DUF6515 family protein [Pseudomonas turukhanskensis]GLK91530.1 hypothetical protein GCM10017655_45940 [Pseudomonas turukhanskensis]